MGKAVQKSREVEDKIIKKIDLLNHCKAGLRELRKAFQNPKFMTEIHLQHEAVKIMRGIDLKIRAIYIQDTPSAEELIAELRGALMVYGGQFNKQVIDLNLEIPKTIRVIYDDKPQQEGDHAG